MRVSDLAIKVLRESLEVDVGSIHVNIKIPPCLWGNIPRRYRDALKTNRPTGSCRINRILRPYDRVVVGKRNTLAPQLLRSVRDKLGFRNRTQFRHLPGFRDVPVLTKLTTQVASSCSKRQDTRARIEVIQRLLFNGIDTKTCAATVGIEHHLVPLDLAHKTKAPISFLHFALPRTKIANDSIACLVPMPPFSWMCLTHLCLRSFCVSLRRRRCSPRKQGLKKRHAL